jgi:hypothetical protein
MTGVYSARVMRERRMRPTPLGPRAPRALVRWNCSSVTVTSARTTRRHWTWTLVGQDIAKGEAESRASADWFTESVLVSTQLRRWRGWSARCIGTCRCGEGVLDLAAAGLRRLV